MMRRSPAWRAALCTLAVGTALATPAARAGAPRAQVAQVTPVRAAACVAALKSRAEPLAERVKRRDAAAETQLLPIVMSSFAFIGTVYKQGLRQPEADALLRQAEAEQSRVPPAELARTQDACHAEGMQLLGGANYLERQIVEMAARRRIEKLHPAP